MRQRRFCLSSCSSLSHHGLPRSHTWSRTLTTPLHATTRHSHLLPTTSLHLVTLCFGYKLTVTTHTTGLATIKRPRTRSTTVRQVNNAHEQRARTGETYDWRVVARTLLSSCLPLPVVCSVKTSYPASHPHNTTPLHAATPHSHLPLYSHPPTPTPSNTPFCFAKLLTLGYAFASSWRVRIAWVP